MFDPGTRVENEVRAAVLHALDTAAQKDFLPETDDFSFTVETPKDTSNGDLACNIAMTKSKEFKLPPRKIAEIIVGEMDFADSYIESVEIAGPGFINFFLDNRFYSDALGGILKSGEQYGRTEYGQHKKYMVEFVSANPTGPMHLGNARGGALGDCLASVLDAAGYDVTREFYVNDAGNQIEKFGISLESRYLERYVSGITFPEDGYQGQDIIERARGFADIYGDSYVNKPEAERRRVLVDYALPLNIEDMKANLFKYRIKYDVWFHESQLYKDGTVDKIIDILRDKNALYEKDGALWYRATDFGGEKDEVLIRGNGNATYFAADIAYHYNKFVARGFDTVIDIWGADHHGHVARLKGAMDAIGLDGDKLDIVIMQMVNLMQDGAPVRMSKRTGKAITLSTLLEEIPVDAARFFFNMREPKSHLDFDLDLAAKQSSDNPVYYVQYAHARICSILKALDANGIDIEKAKDYDLSALQAPDERALIKHLAYLPGEIIAAAKEYDPARITRYVVELATLFHRFYTNCRVKGEEDDIMYPRISLCVASRQVIRNCFALLKITAPESM